jgi:hypothetical protein
MPVYFGLPININEAIRIIKLDNDTMINKIKKDHPHYCTHLLYKYINEYLTKHQNINSKHKMLIYSTDKGQFVLGYELIEISDVWNNIISVDKTIVLLLELKKKFHTDIRLFQIDLSCVAIEHMESEPTYENFPDPYILEWN